MEKNDDILDEYMKDIRECIQALDEAELQPKTEDESISCKIYEDMRYYVGKRWNEELELPAYTLCLVSGDHSIELSSFRYDETGEYGLKDKEYVIALLAMVLFVFTEQDK